MILDNIKKVYFIGIGGSSMSSLAEILKLRGYTVSGSDMQEGETVKSLRNKEISLYIGHNAGNIAKESPDIVIKTDAIADNNPELVYAKEHKIIAYTSEFQPFICQCHSVDTIFNIYIYFEFIFNFLL
jgi:UDP-N-acetylmuramate--alanine ligase